MDSFLEALDRAELSRVWIKDQAEQKEEMFSKEDIVIDRNQRDEYPANCLGAILD